jgi:hypothetical protein
MTANKKGAGVAICLLLALFLFFFLFSSRATFAEAPQELQSVVIYPSAFGITPALDTLEPIPPTQEPFREIGILWLDRYIGGGTTGTLAQQLQEASASYQPVGFTPGVLLVLFVPGVSPDDPRLSDLMVKFDAQLLRTFGPYDWRIFKLNAVTTREETLQAREEFLKHELVEGVDLNFLPCLDVLPGHWAFDFIYWLYSVGMTSGCSIIDYCPDDPVTRGQMAVFLVTALGQSPVECTGRFIDVPIGHPFCGHIERMFDAGAGITAGCLSSGPTFCVDEPVARAQMAVFIEAALGNSPNACTGTKFTDVTPASVGEGFCGFIERLADDGITGGCSPTTFCPFDPVTRAQMAVYLWMAFLSQPSFQTALTLKDAAGTAKNEFTIEEPITFELTVSNLANSPRILILPTCQQFDFLVGGDLGILWNWSHDKGFCQAVIELSFGPLETKKFSIVWDQKDNSAVQAQAGTYQAQGFVATGEEKVELVLSPGSPARSPITTFTIR